MASLGGGSVHNDLEEIRFFEEKVLTIISPTATTYLALNQRNHSSLNAGSAIPNMLLMPGPS